MSKGNFTKGADGSLVYSTVAKPGSAPSLDSSKWYIDKCEIAGYGPEHLTIKINADGIIRVDGNFKDEKASRSFFKEYIIPDGVDYEAIEFGIYETDKNTLVIVGAISTEAAPTRDPAAPAPPPPAPVAQQQQATTTETSCKIVRTENERVTSTFSEAIESSELEGSEDISKEVRVADRKFETKLNVSEYKTEEVHVKISRKVVLIYTSRKETTTTTTSSTRKEIKKRFEIPAGVKPESITSIIEKDGNLTISAPVDEELAKQQTKTTTEQTSTTTTTSNQQQQQVTEQKQQDQVTEQQQQQVTEVTTSKEVALQQQQVQQTTANADEVVLRTRTVNTVKNVTGKDLQGVKIEKDRFEMNVDVREYSLQEITIKIIKTRRVVTISASHKSQFESRSLFREFTLPAGAPDSNPDAVDAVLNSNGILTISGPCAPLPAALTDITNDVVRSTQDSQIQQQQTQTQTQTSQTQQIQQQQHEQHQHQTVQKSSYTKITRKTFTSSTMTSLDVTGTEDDAEPPTEPGTPVEDVSEELVEDEDGNLIVELNVKDYRAEDIKVRVSKTTITISGRKSEEIREENKLITRIRQFCKKIRIPAGVVVTPQSITSNLDTAEGVLVITIVRSKTTTRQVTQQQPQEQQLESVQQQQQKQEQTSVQETQTQTQTRQQQQQQVESVQQQQQRQVESQQTLQSVESSVQKTNQQTTETTESVEKQQQQQQKIESVQQTNQQQLQQQTEVVQKEQQQQQVQQFQQNVDQQRQVQQLQQFQQQQQVDNTQKSTTTTTSTSKRTIRTSITTTESLQKLGYNFDSATTQVYTGDPKFFERATPIVDYKPEDLEVKIAFPWVIIEGKQEMSAENGWRSKQFTKMFTVPEGVNPENIHLELNEAGDVVNCTAPIG